jgi:hypothetical protein
LVDNLDDKFVMMFTFYASPQLRCGTSTGHLDTTMTPIHADLDLALTASTTIF